MSNETIIKTTLNNFQKIINKFHDPKISLINQYIQEQSFESIRDEIYNGYRLTKEQEKKYLKEIQSVYKEQGENFFNKIKESDYYFSDNIFINLFIENQEDNILKNAQTNNLEKISFNLLRRKLMQRQKNF